jgi:HAD superfamily hydrolase (TIGR01662 family)
MARKIDVVLFDLGNTLLYFDGVWDEVYRQMFLTIAQEIKVIYPDIDIDGFIPHFRKLFLTYMNDRQSGMVEVPTLSTLNRAIVAFGFSPISAEVGKRVLKKMYAVSEEHWFLPVDTKPVLNQLISTGYRLGIICNAADYDNAHNLIDKARIRDYFEYISISAAEGIRKPSIEIFQRALDFFKVEPRKTVMVGDQLGTDILGAKNTGINSIWLTQWLVEKDNLRTLMDIKPDAVINHLQELPALLENWIEG